MKFYFMLIMICIISLSGCKNNIDEKKTLRMAISSTYHPFSYVENNELKGFDIDLGKLIARELKSSIEFKDYAFINTFVALQNRQIDFKLNSSVTDERKENFDFSTKYLYQDIVILYKTNNPIINKDELKNKKIGVMLGSVHQAWIKKNNQNNKVISMDYAEQLIEILKLGEIDGFLHNKISAKSIVKNNKNLNYSFVAQADQGVAAMVKKGNTELLNKINDALETLKKNGEIKRLEKKWLYTDE